MTFSVHKLVGLTPEQAADDYDVTVFINDADGEYYVTNADAAKLPTGKTDPVTISEQQNDATAGTSPVIKRRRIVTP